MPERVKALVLTGPRQYEICEFDKPPIGDGDMLLRVKLCGICFSDVHLYEGDFHGAHPYIPGHEFVGEVAEIGQEARRRRGLEVGDQVAVELIIPCGHCEWCKRGDYAVCLEDRRLTSPHGRQYGYSRSIHCPPVPLWGGYAQYLFVPGEAYVHKFRRPVPWKAAVLTEPLAISVKGVGLGQVSPGKSCCVVGPGPIGLLACVVAKHSGASPVVLVGTRQRRLELGKKLGADYVVNIRQSADPLVATLDPLGGQGADVTVECAGTPDAQSFAVKVTKPGSKCVFLGLTGGRRLTLDVDDDVTFRGITIIGSYLSSGAYEGAVSIIESARWPLEEMVTHEVSLEDAPKGWEISRNRIDEAVKVVVNPWA